MGYNLNLPRYDKLKEKYQSEIKHNEYEEIIINSFISGFECDFGENEPYTVFHRLITCGELGVCENGVIGFPVRQGKLNINGELDKITSVLSLDGNEYKGECLPLYMLPSKKPITTFNKFADLLSEIDISQKALVIGSRYNDIIQCNDEREKNQIDEIFKNIEVGKIKTIASISPLFNKETNILRITDPQKMGYMEYLSSYHTELCRRIYGLFGVAMSGKDKQAQVNEKELEGRSLSSVIYPLMLLTTLQKCIEKINDKFALNWYVKPSAILQKALYDVMIDNDTDGLIDSVENNKYESIDNKKDGENNVNETERV